MKIQISQIKESKLNSNVMPEEIREKLISNIKLQGGKYPQIIVRKIAEKPTAFDIENTVGEPEGYRIIDGHNRKWALEQLKYTEAECDVWEIDDKTEMLLMATLNELKGTQDFSKRADLLNKIIAVGVQTTDLLKLIPEDNSRLDFILSLANKTTAESLENVEHKRAELREKFIKDGFNAEEAGAMADIYAFKEYIPKNNTEVEGKKVGERPVMIFFFSNKEEYEMALDYFEARDDKEPKTAKLVELLKNAKSNT